MSFEYVHQTERMVALDGTEVIVQLAADTFGGDGPREDDNFTCIYGDHRRYTIGDGKPPREHEYILDRGGIRLLYRYMRLFGDPVTKSKVLAFAKLGMIDHSGISFYTVPVGSSATHWADYGGWDSGAVGYVYITQSRWDYMGGGDPNEPVDGEVKFPLGSVPVKVTRAARILEQEVETYDLWSQGNVWSLVATQPCDHPDQHRSDKMIAACPHSPVYESLGGYIGYPDDAWRDMTADLGLKPLNASVTA